MATVVAALAAALVLVIPVIAEDYSQPSGMGFRQIKQLRLQRIDQMRECVSRAINIDQMDACRPWRKKRDAD